MKFKYIKTSQQGQPTTKIVDEQPKLDLVSNVTYEIVETGTIIPATYKTIERTIPTLTVDATLNVIQIEAAVNDNGLSWLQSTFGASNVVTE